MTQLEYAKNEKLSPLVKKIALEEGVSLKSLLAWIKDGRAVIPLNKNHNIPKPCAIGFGLRTKVNANVGTSTDELELNDELKKVEVSIKYGADTIMDLSVGGDLNRTREEIIAHSTVPVGKVHIYEIAVNAQNKYGDLLKFDIDDILEALVNQAKQGVDFFTIHAGVTRESLRPLKKEKRLLGIVSRGGAILANWIACYKKENPFYEYFDKILDIAHTYDITLSLGDGLRPGSILDASDKAQFSELKILGALARRAKRRNVQVIIEGPGHVRINEIKKNILLEKKLCHKAPFYILGPLVTDIAAGYDHISSAIGACLAASYGADFICYVTASEHLRHPSIEDVKEGVIASKIAAHAADIAKGVKKAILWDKKMSQARKIRDWKKQAELSLDPEKANSFRASSRPLISDACTMCGEYCSIKLSEKCIG